MSFVLLKLVRSSSLIFLLDTKLHCSFQNLIRPSLSKLTAKHFDDAFTSIIHSTSTHHSHLTRTYIKTLACYILLIFSNHKKEIHVFWFGAITDIFQTSFRKRCGLQIIAFLHEVKSCCLKNVNSQWLIDLKHTCVLTLHLNEEWRALHKVTWSPIPSSLEVCLPENAIAH